MPIPKIKYCENCNKPLERKNFKGEREFAKRKFCNKECMKMGCRIYFNCDYCGKMHSQQRWYYKKYNNHFCGVSCSIKWAKQIQMARIKNTTYPTRDCKCCGKKMPLKTEKDNNIKKYCNWNCRKKAKRVIFNCDNCGKRCSQIKAQYNQAKHHFCNHKCMGEWRNKQPSKAKVQYICKECGIEFERFRSVGTGDFCSNSCKSSYWGKRNSSFYIDGRTPLRFLIKNSSKYDNWRLFIMDRDNYTCQECGKTNCKLHVHHRVGFSELFDSFMKNNSDEKNKDKLLENAMKYKPFWNVNNGKTLCIVCHKEKHPEINFNLGG